MSCSRAIGQQAGEQEMCQWNDIFDLLFDTTTNNWPGVERKGGGAATISFHMHMNESTCCSSLVGKYVERCKLY